MARGTDMTPGRLGIVAVVLIAATALAVSRSTASDLSEVMAELGDGPSVCEELDDALRAGDLALAEASLDAGSAAVLLPRELLDRVTGYTCSSGRSAGSTSFGVALTSGDGEQAVVVFTPPGRSDAVAAELRRSRADDDRTGPSPRIEVVDDTTVWVGDDGRSASAWGVDWTSPHATPTEVLGRVAAAVDDTG